MKTAMEVRTMYEQMMPPGFDKALPGSLANACVEMMVSQYMHLQQEFKDLLALVAADDDDEDPPEPQVDVYDGRSRK